MNMKKFIKILILLCIGAFIISGTVLADDIPTPRYIETIDGGSYYGIHMFFRMFSIIVGMLLIVDLIINVTKSIKGYKENNDKERILLIEKCFLLVSVIILYIDNSECFSLLEMSSILCFAISCLLLVCILCTRIYFAFKNRKSIENLK